MRFIFAVLTFLNRMAVASLTTALTSTRSLLSQTLIWLRTHFKRPLKMTVMSPRLKRLLRSKARCCASLVMSIAGADGSCRYILVFCAMQTLLCTKSSGLIQDLILLAPRLKLTILRSCSICSPHPIPYHAQSYTRLTRPTMRLLPP